MAKLTGAAFCYYIMQFFNSLIFLLGIALIGNGFYLWITVKVLNSFIFTIALIGLFIMMTTLYGYYCTRNSPSSLIIYQIFLFILTVLSLLLGFFIIYDQQQIVLFLTANMTDSADNILQTQNAINKNLYYTKISLIVYSVATVKYF